MSYALQMNMLPFHLWPGCSWQVATSLRRRLRDAEMGEGTSDEDITPLHSQSNPPFIIEEPITRARARQLDLEVSSFLIVSLHENSLLPYDYVMIRNQAEDQEIYGGRIGDVEVSEGQPNYIEVQYHSSSSPPWSPAAACLILDARARYGV